MRTKRRAFSMSACPGSMPSYSISSALAAARPIAPPIMVPTPGIGMNEPSALPAIGSATLASDFKAGNATLPTALEPAADALHELAEKLLHLVFVLDGEELHRELQLFLFGHSSFSKSYSKRFIFKFEFTGPLRTASRTSTGRSDA